MKKLVEMKFGSHVYGTNTPESDLDYKAIYIPSPREIILGRAKETIQQSTKEDERAKNTSEDVDTEIFSLKQYVKLLLEGQTVAIDMLFTPKKFYTTTPNWWWSYLQQNKDAFLHSGYLSFAGYCRTQANKYGIKGSRVNAVRLLLEVLSRFDDHYRLTHAPILKALYELIYVNPNEALEFKFDHLKFVNINGPNGNQMLHVECCNRKMPVHNTVKQTKAVYQRIFDEYGARALQAEKNEGVDWKALMHAVRIANQAKEILLTGNIVFPRPEAELLLKIRKGEVPYKEVAEMIEQGLETMQAISEVSVLPKEPNRVFADELVYLIYLESIR
jgi:predicted nucleotidyltransferase